LTTPITVLRIDSVSLGHMMRSKRLIIIHCAQNSRGTGGVCQQRVVGSDLYQGGPPAQRRPQIITPRSKIRV
jgi:hypothetical protein